MLGRRIVKTLLFLATIAIFGLAGLWFVGSQLISPAQAIIGPPPSDLPAQAVVFPDAAGESIHGWFVAGTKGQGAVLLLHGVRADRRAMINRARFLRAAGYAVLLIDFQGSGESPGKAITFGYREAADVKASLRYLRQRLPGERVGIIGTSMGGAATILAEPDVDADAVVLEQVVSHDSTGNRRQAGDPSGTRGTVARPHPASNLALPSGHLPRPTSPDRSHRAFADAQAVDRG
jgi:pimeloyl-ACP methyl ester carboxylesterase